MDSAPGYWNDPVIRRSEHRCRWGLVLVGLMPLLSLSAQVFPLPTPTRPTSFPLPIPARPTVQGTVVAWGNNGGGQVSVPAGLSGIVAVAAGGSYSVALRNDGTLAAWGKGWNGSTYVDLPLPVGLSRVVSVSVGGAHSSALRDDGTVVAWGKVYNGTSYVDVSLPAGLSGVVAVSAADAHGLALKSDGTVIAWGFNTHGQTSVPTGLGQVVAVSAGDQHSLALKSDGTVVAWGRNDFSVPTGFASVGISAGGNYSLAIKDDGAVIGWGYTVTPVGITGAVRVATGYDRGLVLKSDGKASAWGYGSSGQSSIPTGVSNLVMVSAGSSHNLALRVFPPTVSTAAQSQSVTVGNNVSFTVSVSGDSPLHFQWRKNGESIQGATNGLVALTNVQTSDAGVYSVVVSNVIGSVTNGGATLTVNVPPSISTQPQSQTVNSGATVSFTTSAVGTVPLTNQWRINGTILSGKTSSTITLSSVTTANAGSYTVRVSNAGGSVVSAPAILTVFNLTVDGLAAGSSIFRPGPALVAVGSYFPGGFTFYTLDGSAPTTSSTLYTGPFTLPSSATVRVLALSSDFLQSVPGPAVAVQIVPFYSVSLTTAGGGSASVSPAQASYPSNSVVTLTAMPDAGWTFLHWEGDASSTNNPLALTLNAAQTVRAIFGTPVARIAVAGGSVEFEPERVAYDFGSKLRAKALPNAGNKFVVWSGALSGITNGLDLTVTQSGQMVSALFAALAGNEASLVALPVGPGSVTLNPHKNAYTLGEMVQITATADSTNQLLGWTGDLSGTASPVDVTINASKRMTAFFGQPVPPVILAQPQGTTALAGTNLTLSVEASGPPLGFQWFHRGQALAGATNTTLSLPNLARAQGGAYSVVITNLIGSTNSSNVVVRVLAPALFLPPEFTTGNPLRLRFGDNGVGGVLTTNDVGNFEVHVSTNATGTNWLRLNVPLSVTNGQIAFEDGESASLPRRFYRVIER